jgi:hypothetical protein
MNLNIDDVNQFIKRVTEAKDPLVSLIKGHLYIEGSLIQLIKLGLENPDFFDPTKLNFPNKVRLACALGFIEKDEIKFLLFLNDLRNSLAHQVDKELDLNDGKRLFEMLRETKRFQFALNYHPILKSNPNFFNPDEFPEIIHVCILHFVGVLEITISHFQTKGINKKTLPFTREFYSK